MWRKLKNRKPKKEGLYIIYAPSVDPKLPFINMAWWYKATQEFQGFYTAPQWIKAITHWKPKPKSPFFR